MRIKILLTIALIGCVSIAQAQNKKVLTMYTADSLASGSSKDVVASFFQMAFNNLNGPNKEFNFSSNPYAVMLKSNPKLSLAEQYERYKTLRRLNFSFGLKVDSNFKFNGFSSGIKFKIVDDRDHTTSKEYINLTKNDDVNKDIDALAVELQNYSDNKWGAAPAPGSPDFKAKEKFIKDYNEFMNNTEVSYNSMSKEFKDAVEETMKLKNLVNLENAIKKVGDFNFSKYDKKLADSLKNVIKMGWLWTVGLSDTTYNNEFVFSNVALTTEINKGIYKPRAGANNLELNFKAGLNFLTDTIQSDKNLKRLILNSELGLNWVIRDAQNEKSYFETKLAAAYRHNFNNLYNTEERSTFTMNGTARVRIYNDIWIPFDIKWDPNNGSVFGKVSVKSNFIGIASLLK
jgi:hypothetical protein